MRRHLALLALVLIVVAGCSDDSDDNSNAGGGSTTTTAATVGAVVEIRDVALHPADVTVRSGEGVTWRFDDEGVAHDIKGAIFDSGRRTSGAYTFTFDEPGTSTYHCTIHPEMRGTVTVT
jgi:plastocyanin